MSSVINTSQRYLKFPLTPPLPNGERIKVRGHLIFITPHPDLLPSMGEGIHLNILKDKFSDLNKSI